MVLLRRFRDPIWVPRMENQVPTISENRDPTGPYRVPNISLSKNPFKCVEYEYTQPAQCRLVKTDTTEQFIASLEVEQQGSRHLPNTIVH